MRCSNRGLTTEPIFKKKQKTMNPAGVPVDPAVPRHYLLFCTRNGIGNVIIITPYYGIKYKRTTKKKKKRPSLSGVYFDIIREIYVKTVQNAVTK